MKKTKKIIVITGGKGSGKTTAAITHVPPSEIKQLLYIDTEDSASDFEGLGFEHIRMYERLAPDEDMLALLEAGRPPWVSKEQRNTWVGYYEYLIKTLNQKLAQGKFKYLVIDTVGPVEMALTAAVEADRQAFGWSGQTAYGKKEVEGVRPLYDNLLEAISRRGVETIILTSHLKSVWIDKKPVLDKIRPGGRLKLLSTISSMMVWLVSGNSAVNAPAGLILKARMGLTTPSKDGDFWDTQAVLPERMPVFTWREVANYQANPANFANPAPGERMSPDEQDMISELLSDKSMELMIANKRLELQQASNGMLSVPGTSSGPVGIVQSSQDKARAMIAAGKSRPEIIKATNLSMGDVVKLENEQ